MASSFETIYVALLDRGAEAWRPVLASRRQDGTYQIMSTNDDPEDELWQFPPGSLVHCEQRDLPEGPRQVAVAIVPPVPLKQVWPIR